jgi:hypothetical protein
MKGRFVRGSVVLEKRYTVDESRTGLSKLFDIKPFVAVETILSHPCRQGRH